MNRLDDTIARYDPLEAISEIAERTGDEPRVVALVLEGEIDYLGCLGLLDEGAMDEVTRQQFEEMKRENSDLIELTDGEYDTDVAVSFVQRNRGIDKETTTRILAANYSFMDDRGFLDDEWGEAWVAKGEDAGTPEE